MIPRHLLEDYVVEYAVGDVIEYQAFGGTTRRVLVQEKDENIKNGRPGFDGVMVGTDDGVWGYDSQIIRVIERGRP